MARDWIEIGKYVYEHANGTSTDASSGGLGVTLYYDKNSLTATSVDIKFKGSGGSNNGWSTTSKNGGWTNGYCVVVLNPSVASYQLGIIKDSDTMTTDEMKASYRECTFTVTKNYNVRSFSIPFWICNFGNVWLNVAAKTVPYSYPAGTSTVYNYDVYKIFNGTASHNNRTPYKTAYTATVQGALVGNTNLGSIGIEDLGNNSFKVAATSTTPGAYNPLLSVKLLVNGVDYSSYLKAADNYAGETPAIHIDPAPSGKTFDVTAELIATSTYNNSDKYNKATVTDTVNYYFSPRRKLMYKPTLVAPYTDKVVLKGQGDSVPSCTWNWKPELEYSAEEDWGVAGYGVVLEWQPKESIGTETKFMPSLYDTDGNILGELIYYTDHADVLSVTFDPSKIATNPAIGLVAAVGDQVRLGVIPYSRNGNLEICTVNINNAAWSRWIPIKQNAIMQVRTPNDGWCEGQVQVKVTDPETGIADWVEATAVYVKVGDSWEESM